MGHCPIGLKISCDKSSHQTRPRIARALAMLRGKTVEMAGRKRDNLPV
jgi:hypothetical protein